LGEATAGVGKLGEAIETCPTSAVGFAFACDRRIIQPAAVPTAEQTKTMAATCPALQMFLVVVVSCSATVALQFSASF